MKHLLLKLWQSIKSCKIAAILLGEALFWSPLIVLGIMGIISGSAAVWGAFAAVYTFWVLLLPAIPIQILFIFTINKIMSWSANKNHAAAAKEITNAKNK